MLNFGVDSLRFAFGSATSGGDAGTVSAQALPNSLPTMGPTAAPPVVFSTSRRVYFGISVSFAGELNAPVRSIHGLAPQNFKAVAAVLIPNVVRSRIDISNAKSKSRGKVVVPFIPFRSALQTPVLVPQRFHGDLYRIQTIHDVLAHHLLGMLGLACDDGRYKVTVKMGG